MIIKTVINALAGNDWKTGFANDRRAFVSSFIALIMTVPFGLLIAKAILQFNANTKQFPLFAISLTLFLIAFSFPALAWIFAKVPKRQANLQAWLIIRNWAFFLIMALFAAIAGLYLLGILPFSFVYFFGLGLYLATLAIDIRLAGRVGGFDWMIAVLIAIVISVTTMMIILFALGQSL